MRNSGMLVSLVALVAACTPEETIPTAPNVAEPRSGEVFDRCLMRVRMSGLDELGDGLSDHGSWRINGGGGDEVTGDARDTRSHEDFLFGATLVPGANHLEAGRCDAFDFCGWTAVDVRVELGAGSPDPAFAGAGQIVFDHTDITSGFTILEDGRPLYGTWAKPVPGAHPLAGAVIARRLDGTLDPTFGTAGIVSPPGPGLVRPVAIAGGGFLLSHVGSDLTTVSYLSRHDRNGVVDPSFGVGGIVELRDPDTAEMLYVGALVGGADGSVLIAGAAFVAELAPDGALRTFTRFEPGPLSGFMALDLDATGNVALLFTDHVVRASLDGLVTTFGTGGTATFATPDLATFPSPLGGVVLHAGGVAIAQAVTDNVTSQVRITLLSAIGAATSFVIPFASSPSTLAQERSRAASIVAAPDGSLYIASTITHPAAPEFSWNLVPEDGSDLAVSRVRNGALDPTFGDAGIAHASLMLSWKTVAMETLYDLPTSIAIGPNGAPWLLATSVSTDASSADLYTARGPGLGLVTFMP